jgi:hypothetical protein
MRSNGDPDPDSAQTSLSKKQNFYLAWLGIGKTQRPIYHSWAPFRVLPESIKGYFHSSVAKYKNLILILP